MQIRFFSIFMLFIIVGCGLTQNGNGHYSSQSCPDSGMCSGTPVSAPLAPSSLVATPAGSTQIDLTWKDLSSNETGFIVQRSSDGILYTDLATVGAGEVYYASISLFASTKYYYRIQSYNSAGASDYIYANATTAAPPVAPPAAPSNLMASAISSSQINLGWQDLSNNEGGFKIQRSQDGVSYVDLVSLPANAVSYSNTGLTSATKYYYRLQSYNSVGASSYILANATTQTIASSPPGKLVYDTNCMSCHRLGTYDTSGSPDLKGKSTSISGKLAGGHQGISLTSQQITDLVNFVAMY